MSIRLSKRLSAAVSFVEKGARVLDVGTDHAYVPIYLIQSGICDFAAGSDINRGPLEAAERNARENGVSEKIRLYLSDGLKDTECENNAYDHILICGMGGEMIASIIDASDYTRVPGVKLILQPMTMQSQLRTYLAENAFAVTDETIIRDQKLYQYIVCTYTGEKYGLSPVEKLIGRINIIKGKTNPEFVPYVKGQISILEKIKIGKENGGGDTSEEDALLDVLRGLVQDHDNL